MSPAIANHLLQSTIFALAAAVLTLFLRNNPARTRYWIWLTASLKFLIPFSLFIELGHHLSWTKATTVIAQQPTLAIAIDTISQPFAIAPTPVSTTPAAPVPMLPDLLLAIWIIGSATVLIYWLIRWYRVVALLRSPGAKLEPGVFGIIRPVLYLPPGIADHLDGAQLKAIVAHEHCHIRNRDNLTAALHSLVEAVFWFHPLTWWIGARLVEERERACDEEVVRLGSDPEVYAESILKICKLYIESPLVCVSGITGSDLKKRIATIMTSPLLTHLSATKKAMLATAGALALAAPITVGILSAPAGRTQSQKPSSATSEKPVAAGNVQAPQAVPPPAAAKPFPAAAPARQEFETASVKPVNINLMDAIQSGRIGWKIDDALVDLQSVSLSEVMAQAYNVPPNQIEGAPGWMNSQRFDIRAKLPKGSSKKQVPAMLQSLLTDRFALTLHHQSETRPVYELRVGKKLNLNPSVAPPPDDEDRCKPSNGHRVCVGMTMGDLADVLSAVGELGAAKIARGGDADYLIDRPVVDMTGLNGAFDFNLDYGRVATDGGRGRGGDGPMPPLVRLRDSIDALGLKLEPAKRLFDVIIIDHVERTATEN